MPNTSSLPVLCGGCRLQVEVALPEPAAEPARAGAGEKHCLRNDPGTDPPESPLHQGRGPSLVAPRWHARWPPTPSPAPQVTLRKSLFGRWIGGSVGRWVPGGAGRGRGVEGDGGPAEPRLAVQLCDRASQGDTRGTLHSFALPAVATALLHRLSAVHYRPMPALKPPVVRGGHRCVRTCRCVLRSATACRWSPARPTRLSVNEPANAANIPPRLPMLSTAIGTVANALANALRDGDLLTHCLFVVSQSTCSAGSAGALCSRSLQQPPRGWWGWPLAMPPASPSATPTKSS